MSERNFQPSRFGGAPATFSRQSTKPGEWEPSPPPIRGWGLLVLPWAPVALIALWLLWRLV